MTDTTLTDLIRNYSSENLAKFFRWKSRDFAPTKESINHISEEGFQDIQKLGEIQFSNKDQLLVCSIKVTKDLTERSGKKAQFELAKKILKYYQDLYDGIFVFHDANGNFRFSLIYANYLGTHKSFSNYRRFTYYVSPQLTNNTFKQRVGNGDFSSLDKIKEAFSVEKVTKEFYQEISYWYFWACQQVRFPEAAEREDNGRQVSVIRMITRLIFIWFMREKGLVPAQLFDRQTVEKWLRELDDQSSSYYLAVLQNLFFATLNTKVKNRQFRSEVRGPNGHNPDFDNPYKYRHQALFAQPERLEEYFCEIPFLNGGLFDCLDNKRQGDYFDGFSDVKKNQPYVPNQLFFSPEQPADFNNELGTKNQKFKVKGLFEILGAYNFTIDENTADDKDVALDPELLGRVFENLLASFNPETSTTARKATGSYYTPREIVDYMVDESLKAYLRQNFQNLPEVDQNLDWLLSPQVEGNPFTAKQSERIIRMVENVRIVDPAVGSGAFPMGVLNKLVLILSKLDPHGNLWERAQLDSVAQIPDPQIRAEVQSKIRRSFQEKNHDYGRKLYLIQKCIYGVDIQQIAVEIAKLRFFISLLVDETVDREKDNWGIEPLPNLDFKIMQGNSLISVYEGIDLGPRGGIEPSQPGLYAGQGEKAELIRLLRDKKAQYQGESDHNNKQALQKEIDKYLLDIFKVNALEQRQEYASRLAFIDRKYQSIPDPKTREKLKAIEKEKVSKEMGININASGRALNSYSTKQMKRDFFPWGLFFAEVFEEKGGFDIAISNPPYVKKENLSREVIDLLASEFQESTTGKSKGWSDDLYVHFIFKAIDLVKESGIVTFITNDSFIGLSTKIRVRNAFLDNELKSIVKCPLELFDATIYTAVFILQKRAPLQESYTTGLFTYPGFEYKAQGEVKYKTIATIPNKRLISWDPILETYQGLLNHPIVDDYLDILDTGIDSGNSRKKIFFKDNSKPGLYRLLQGRQIQRWRIFWDSPSAKFRFCDPEYEVQKRKGVGRGGRQSKHDEYWHFRGNRDNHHKPERLLMRQTDDDLIVAYHNEEQMGHFYTDNTLFTILPKTSKISLKYAMAIFNSDILNKIYHFLSQEENKTLAQVKVGLVKQLPFIVDEQEKIVGLVDQILAITDHADFLTDMNLKEQVKSLEFELNTIINKIYGVSK